ncbi:unnamed protein product [Onchocerca flexuosa]|uniref:Uncharacterized protein n=1 Tax=Onchocerca flexuosa TaxID=387005 RepID=A0A183HIF4_9BILA|nr:unnamed protein product [Onchocerca flexuosa]
MLEPLILWDGFLKVGALRSLSGSSMSLAIISFNLLHFHIGKIIKLNFLCVIIFIILFQHSIVL